METYADTSQVYYGLKDKSPSELWIIALYFSFTSLSTVGFGDYHPRSNIERFVGAFVLLFGVAIFSFIMGNFIDILNNINEFFEGLDDGENLNKFFGTIKRFNKNTPVNLALKKKIEEFFDYRWGVDKNIAFQSEHDL